MELSDVDWLVMRARSFPKNDPYSAKAWLITAKSLYPQSFVIQFESYLVEKTAKNVDEAARNLQDMLQNFPHEPVLWSEVHSILESLQKEPQDQKVSFLTDLFAAIPTSTQCLMVLHVSESIPDVLDRCQLLLLAMKKFPNLVQEHGLKLVEMLLKEETKSGIVNNPVNCYRKLLVCDVMPMVLHKGGHLEFNMFHLLQKAIEFHLSYVSQPNTHDHTTDTESTKLSLKIGRVGGGFPEMDLQVADPWGNLFRLLILIGQRLNWDMERDLVMKNKEYQIQALQHQLMRAKVTGAEINNKQILHTAMVLFVYSMVNYVSFIGTDSSSTGKSIDLTTNHPVPSVPVVLLEVFNCSRAGASVPSRSKKQKLDVSAPTIHCSSGIASPTAMLQAFELAVKCFEILNSTEEMKFEFYHLCQNWRKETQSMLSYFQTDMCIYQGNYQDAVMHLQSLTVPSNSKMKVRNSLQMASCYFGLKQFAKACEQVLDLVDTIPSSGPMSSTLSADDSTEEKGETKSGRRLLMLQCLDGEVLPFCLHFLIAGLKEKLASPQRTDSTLAHLIILLQHDWPKHESTFSEVISIIQMHGSFTYNTFFSYVHQVDILEEFAFLDTPEGGKVNLDIMPISTKALAQQRTVTRGVNKGVKEDFRATLEKQVSSAAEPADVLIRRFLKEEREEILKNFV
ncbi:unnamed protein product [Candidula unifasciata]|uniref:Integrator complex subunit 10 n=1 Tax=Candidula unifasciata TaxID=100452 RepID=A0A8S3ZBT1_9EUPU|nr:unnamed protein product [Candidula unifasciata]